MLVSNTMVIYHGIFLTLEKVGTAVNYHGILQKYHSILTL